MSLMLLLNPQAVLAIDLLCDIIEKYQHSWPQGPSDTLTVTYSMARDIGKCVGKMADGNIPENVKK